MKLFGIGNSFCICLFSLNGGRKGEAQVQKLAKERQVCAGFEYVAAQLMGAPVAIEPKIMRPCFHTFCDCAVFPQKIDFCFKVPFVRRVQKSCCGLKDCPNGCKSKCWCGGVSNHCLGIQKRLYEFFWPKSMICGTWCGWVDGVKRKFMNICTAAIGIFDIGFEFLKIEFIRKEIYQTEILTKWTFNKCSPACGNTRITVRSRCFKFFNFIMRIKLFGIDADNFECRFTRAMTANFNNI